MEWDFASGEETMDIHDIRALGSGDAQGTLRQYAVFVSTLPCPYMLGSFLNMEYSYEELRALKLLSLRLLPVSLG
jgi:hypothetical protein